MPQDHYVSQVHLKNFAAKELGADRLWGIRKRDLFIFPCATRDICRVLDGSTNPFMREPRVIEDFLLTVEPKYNSALASFRSGAPDHEAVYVIAGFVAYVASCSPAAVRLHSEPLRAMVAAQTRMLEVNGRLPPPPEILGSASISEMIESGAITIDIDGKYPQSIGISTILERLSRYGNAVWEILHNDLSDSPFLTSDYPIAIDRAGDNRIMHTIIPLSPDLAVRIIPDLEELPENIVFPRFRYRNRKLDRDGVRGINVTIARCAEEALFFPKNEDWVRRFVARHKDYHVAALTDRIPVPTGGEYVLNRFRVERRLSGGS
jgi:hypothetical protein